MQKSMQIFPQLKRNIENRKIINNYNILGKTKKTKSREINIVIYDDGTVEKKIIID